VAIGEILIDLVSIDALLTVEKAVLFRKTAGGAPANVAVGLARLDCESALIGKVADDSFGRFLQSTLELEGVRTDGLVCDRDARTPLAFVGAGEASERSFIFYHRGMADTTLRVDELDGPLLDHARVVHFGSVTLTAEPGRSTTRYAVERAKEAGALVSFDPNLRLELWSDTGEAAREVRRALELVDIVKVSLDEARLLTGHNDPADAAADLLVHGAALAVVTLGADGAYYRTPSTDGSSPPFRVEVVDPTGAGDGFMAGLLCALSAERDPLTAVRDPAIVARAVEFANATGALTTTEFGAIPALPRLAAVTRLLEAQPPEARVRTTVHAQEAGAWPTPTAR
jgi:fructokinase